MKKKQIDILFVILFLIMITLPLCMLNTTPELNSEQENRAMTKWPGWGFHAAINEWYGHYFEDRIGFRKQAVEAYTRLTYKLFGEFSEDMHMFGKDGYVFPADKAYVQAYQRLKTDEELLGNYTTYVKNLNEYCKKKDIPFVFLAGLDKKTVYSEYMPDFIHVKTENSSIMESLAKHLKQADIPYVIPEQEYAGAKKKQQIYNRMFDCAHWNDLGKMLGIRLADEKLFEQGLDVPVVDAADFDLTYEMRNRLEFVDIDIEEEVPVYHLKQQYELWDNLGLTSEMHRVEGTSIQYYCNVNAKTRKTIFIFHDSFLQDAREFYCNRYRHVYFVSRQNYEFAQYYINLVRPDAVIFENAERAFVDDLYAYDSLAKVEFEPPYESFGKLKKEKKEFQVQLTGAKHASFEGKDVTMEKEAAYFTLQGYLKLPKELQEQKEHLHLYVKYRKKYYEVNYASCEAGEPGIRKNAEAADELGFYGSFLKPKEAEGKMKLIMVDDECMTEYDAGTLNIR